MMQCAQRMVRAPFKASSNAPQLLRHVKSSHTFTLGAALQTHGALFPLLKSALPCGSALQRHGPQQHRPQRGSCPLHVVRAASGEGGGSGDDRAQSTLATVGLWALYAALMGYVLFLAPNQTPTIDLIIVKKASNLLPDEPYQVNRVFYNIWNCLGIYPAIMTALLVPAARTRKGPPVWPFCVASFALGAYALIPYMILWSPSDPPQQLPPAKQETEGWNRLVLKGNETALLPAALLAAAAWCLWGMASAGTAAWADYVQLFDESRLVHASSLDFALFTALVPFWMSVDADGRQWAPRQQLVPLLSFLPLVGPLTYLVLRPKASQQP